MKYKLLFIVFVLTTLNSCKIIQSMKELKKVNAETYSYKIGNKEIKYIPMHHLGEKDFFDDVKNKITVYKKQGFKVYYEEISSNLKVDSIQKDIIRRKVRKIKGFNGTYEDVAQGTRLEKYVKQPSYKELGISENDIRADIDYLQFINEWEKINGEIVLDSIDKNTDFQSKYDKGTFYTNSQYKKIVVEYRTQYLVDLINSKNDLKVLILYGAGHRKNFEKKIYQKTTSR